MPADKALGFLLLISFMTSMAASGQEVVISEFMAKNDTILEDEDGDTSDWVELFNGGNTEVDLAGWSLTDDADEPYKWIFPAVTLSPGVSMIVFASDKDRTDPTGPLHTNFKLSSDGEYLGLIRPDGTVEHEYAPAYPTQQTDISYGLVVDATEAIHISAPDTVHVHVPDSDDQGDFWMLPGHDDSDWEMGQTGVGYETGSGYEKYILHDVGDHMYGQRTSVYVRTTFEWYPTVNGGLPLELRMRYDDGFACWVNGELVAQANAPGNLGWDSVATTPHNDAEALVPERFILGLDTAILVSGTNTVAFQGLNDDIWSSDFLILPELHGYDGGYIEAMSYLATPTPGAVNFTEDVGLGPIIKSVDHVPSTPQANDELVVTCEVIPFDADITSVQLVHRIGFEPESQPVDMTPDGSGGWATSIPGGPADSILRWYILATDTEGDVSRFPTFDDPFNGPQYIGAHVAQSVATDIDLIRMYVADPEQMTEEDGVRGVVVHDGTVFDNVHIRPRGQSSLSWPKQSFKLDFNSGHHIRFFEDGPRQEELNLQSLYSDKTTMRRQLGWEIYSWAGVPGSLAKPVRVHLNGTFYSLSTCVEQPDKRMLDRLGLDENGALYKMFNSCSSAWLDVEKKTREHENHSDLGQIVQGIQEEDPEALRLFLLDHVDIPAVFAYLAATSILHDNDHVAKNYYLYRDSDGDKEWRFIPWDKDLTFGRIYTLDGGVLNDNIYADTDPLGHPLFGDSDHPKISGKWNRFIDAIYRVPQLRSMYLRHLQVQMDALLQPLETPAGDRLIETRIDELRSVTGPEIELDVQAWPLDWGDLQTTDEAIAILKQDYLDTRRFHLYTTHRELGTIPDTQPETPDVIFGIVVSAPSSGDAEEEYIELVNNESVPIDISGWHLDGDVTFTFDIGSVLPAMGTAYVSPDLARFRTRSQSPTGNQGHLVLGPYAGQLASFPCQLVRLLKPDGAIVNTWCNGSPDVDEDGDVDVDDLLLILSIFGCEEDCSYDADGNGVVNVDDVLAIVGAWD
ncbi:MAG: CotH kinase family protein [Phycisphaerales bacterium]|nr:CotH kinase family protein [Phycisphaerales bacterium]